MNNGQSQELIPADLLGAYERYAAEWSRKGISIPEIKISYDPQTEGEFILKDDDGTRPIGSEITVTILKIRNQYSLYEADESKRVRTNEFDSFQENVTLFVADEVVKTAPFADIKAIIKGNADYSKAKFINVIYCLLDKKICRIYSKPASRNNLWQFQADNGLKPPFAFTTKIHTTKERNGTVTFFPMHFTNMGDVSSDQLTNNIRTRMELDNVLKSLENLKATAKEIEPPLPPHPADASHDDYEIAAEIFSS